MEKIKEFFKKNKNPILLTLGIGVAVYLLLFRRSGNSDADYESPETSRIALNLPQAQPTTDGNPTNDTIDGNIYSQLISSINESNRSLSNSLEDLADYQNVQTSLLQTQLNDMYTYINDNISSKNSSLSANSRNTNRKLSNILNAISQQKVIYGTTTDDTTKTQAHLRADSLREQAIALATSEGLDINEVDTGVGYSEYEINGMRF